MIGAGAGQQGRKSSRSISKLNYVGGQRPLEPRQGRGKRSEASERVPSAGGDQGLGEEWYCEQIGRSRLIISAESVK